MDMSALLSALLLGLIEGVTEFLPISSTGHLILATDMLHLATPPGHVMEVVIQLAAILAVCWFYRHKLLQTVCGITHSRESQLFTLKLVIAFLPSAILGALLHGIIKEYLFSPLVVSIMLVVGGGAILLIEKYKPAPDTTAVEGITLRTALYIGLFQVLAMVPGTSRSGATIMGALLLGVERKAAAEFSFFLAIPTMFAATAYDLYKGQEALNAAAWSEIGFGCVTAFIAALFSIKLLLAFLGRHGFGPFAVYRIVIGLAMLGILFS